MNKSTKGALAAACGGVLLLGWAGSLAYWTDGTNIDGETFGSGHLQLTGDTCGAAVWTLDGGATYGSQRIVPGDTLTKTCEFTVEGVGEHLGVTLDTATPGWTASNALTSALTVSAVFEDADNHAIVDGAVVDADETVTATVTVTFGSGATNASNVTPNGLSAALEDVTITATQTHDAA